MKYYGLISGLPVPVPTQDTGLTLGALRQRIEVFLDERDSQVIQHFFYRVDLINLEAMYLGEERWLEGGNLNRDELKRSLQQDFPLNWPLEDPDQNYQDRNLTDRLHRCWQRFYDIQLAQAPEELGQLLAFEISIKNFFAGALQGEMDPEQEPAFLLGGSFDRFAYSRLLIADIQAEHPQLAAVLYTLGISDADERERKMLEARWQFFDYIAFFDPFGLSGLYALLLKFLDMERWLQRDPEEGRRRLKQFSDQLLQTTQAHYK